MSRKYTSILELFDDLFNFEFEDFFSRRSLFNAIEDGIPRSLASPSRLIKHDFFVAPKLRTDVKEIENGYEMTCEIPGAKKEDIKIDIDENILRVSATVSSDSESEKESEGSKYVKRERYRGEFSRAFNIEGIDKDKISAKYENGILTLILPSEEKPEKKTKSISVE